MIMSTLSKTPERGGGGKEIGGRCLMTRDLSRIADKSLGQLNTIPSSAEYRKAKPRVSTETGVITLNKQPVLLDIEYF